jgi:RluA family pseudouridine synthase
MAKPNFIQLPECDPIPILYEDRTVLAIDKPRGWMLVPPTWQNTSWNLQAALFSSVAAGDFWARSRGLKFVRYVHRLDADTTGILLLSKSPGAVDAISELFEDRRMEKTYLAVVTGEPKAPQWVCELSLGMDPNEAGRMLVDQGQGGKPAETHFKVLERHGRFTLVEARPLTGRTHQIRVHLAECGLPIVGDKLYGRLENDLPLGLRAVQLVFKNPFTKQRVDIRAPQEGFLKEFGFAPAGGAPGRRPGRGPAPPPGSSGRPSPEKSRRNESRRR